jgi:AcrR family transcriptional regulator
MADLVALTEVPASSIHYYVDRGVLPAPERLAANRFIYDERHVTALRAIRALRREGRALEEIRRALPGVCGRGHDPTGAVEAYVRRSEKPSPRTRLLDAAIVAFGHGSYHDVSVRSLCALAGVAKGTFYRYFPNKDALFLAATHAVVDRAVAGFTADVERGVAGERAVTFAGHLRECLPLLFELGKRSIQDTGPMVHAAVEVFVQFVRRLGRADGSTSDADAIRDGGILVIMTMVEIFTRLVEAENAAGPDR